MGKLRSLPKAVGHLFSIPTREGGGGSQEGPTGRCVVTNGNLTCPPALGEQIHFPRGSNKSNIEKETGNDKFHLLIMGNRR